MVNLGTDSVDSEEDSDSDDESSGGSEGSCSYSDSNSESDDESSGDEEEDSESNSDCSSEHSEQTFSIQETNFEQVYQNVTYISILLVFVFFHYGDFYRKILYRVCRER